MAVKRRFKSGIEFGGYSDEAEGKHKKGQPTQPATCCSTDEAKLTIETSEVHKLIKKESSAETLPGICDALDTRLRPRKGFRTLDLEPRENGRRRFPVHHDESVALVCGYGHGRWLSKSRLVVAWSKKESCVDGCWWCQSRR